MDKKRMGIIAIIVVVIILVGSFAFISLNTKETKIDLTCNDTIQNGDYITVQLKDFYRNAIPGQVIDLKILDDSGWAHKYNVTTDEMGRGYIQVLGLDNGNYTVHADYNCTLFLKESHTNFAFAIDDVYSW
jgi:hypothetical protein